MIKRWHLVIVTAIAAILALAASPWTLAERTVERHMLAMLSAQLGVTATTTVPGAVALLPIPRIIANDVLITSADGQITARLPRLRADIRLLPLLAGRIEFDQLLLVAPQIEVNVGGEQADSLQMVTSTALSMWPTMPRVKITENGAVFFRRGPGIVSSVRDINLVVEHRVRGEAVQASGGLVWRGEKLDFAFATNSAERGILPMLQVRSDIMRLDFASARPLRQPQQVLKSVDGQLQFSAKSMSRLGSWLASGSPVLLPLGNTALSGRLRISEEGAQIGNASLVLGSDVLDGALDWRRRENRWRLTGTLAGTNLDIGRPQAGVDVGRLTFPDIAATAQIDIDDLVAHDIDLRVSLQRLRLPGMVFTDVAGQIMATDKRLDLSISNAGLYGGLARGRGSVVRLPAGIELRSQLTAERVDLAQFSTELFDVRRMTGMGSYQHNFEASGRTPAELITQASGRFVATARNGDFLGTNLNDAMRRIERQPLSVARDWRGGRTSFEQLAVTGIMSAGNIEISEARGNGQSFRLILDGQISLAERQFRLGGNVQSANGVTTVPFEVIGPILDPSVQVNAKALLERSGAAAPLLQQRAN
ncbi:MAG: AsmA family protein [Bosea sp. (in: a-proteobacteria)]